MTIDIDQQIAEVEREIALRVQVYPKWIKSGSLPQGRADLQLARMRAALETLKRFQRLERFEDAKAD